MAGPQNSSADEPDYGKLGNTRFVEYVNDLISTNVGITSRVSAPWMAMWQNILTRRVDRDQLLKDYINALGGSIDAWFGLWNFPIEWATHHHAPTPAVLLTLDSVSQASTPVSFAPSINVDGLGLECSDLVQVGGTGVIFGDSIRMLPRNAGRVIQVAVVGQGSIHYQRDPNGNAIPVDRFAATGVSVPPVPQNGIPEGLYVGAMSALERPNRRPLGLLAVLVSPPNTPMYPGL